MPKRYGEALLFAYPTSVALVDWAIDEDGLITLWNEAALGPIPTIQQIDDWLNDVTSVGGQTFSQWLTEHGGDPIKTSKRKVRDLIVTDDAIAWLVVGLVQGMVEQYSLGPVPTKTQIENFIKNKLT